MISPLQLPKFGFGKPELVIAAIACGLIGFFVKSLLTLTKIRGFRKLVVVRRAMGVPIGRKSFVFIIVIMLLNVLSTAAFLTGSILLLAEPYVVKTVEVSASEVPSTVAQNSIMVILIDVSYSMLERDYGSMTRLDVAKHIAKEVLKRGLYSEVYVFAFAGDVVASKSCVGDPIPCIEFIESLTPAKRTSLSAALSTLFAFTGGDKRVYAVLLSDGRHNVIGAGQLPLEIAKRLRDTNVKLFVVQVGYGAYSNPYLMKRIAEEAGGEYFDASRFVDEFAKYLSDYVKESQIRDAVEAGVTTTVEVPDYETAYRILIVILLISLAIAIATEVM